VNGGKNTIVISKQVKEVVLGVAGDSRVLEVTRVDNEGRTRGRLSEDVPGREGTGLQKGVPDSFTLRTACL